MQTRTETAGGRYPLIEMKNLDRGGMPYSPADPEVVFVCKGKMLFEYADGEKQLVHEKMFLMHYPESDVCCRSAGDTLLIICRPGQCETIFDFMSLHAGRPDPFAFNEVISNFIDGLIAAFRDGLQDHTYIEAKTRELFSLLRFYYREKFAALLNPGFYTDVCFIEKVSRNVHHGVTVKELARACHMSESGFYKKFESVFRQSPSEFLLENKKRNIYDELTLGNESVSRLGDIFGFATTSNFGRFCKKYFGMSPGEIRKKHSPSVPRKERITGRDYKSMD